MNVTSEGLRKLMVGQIAIALFAGAVTVAAAFSVAPLFHQREQLQKEVLLLKDQVTANFALLAESSSLMKAAHKIDFMTAKHLYGSSPCAARVLSDLLEAQNNNVKWQVNGTSSEQGFDSPRFAAWLLEHQGVLSHDQFDTLATADTVGAQQKLMGMLAAKLAQTAPTDGDVVFYKTGYTMFYFNDYSAMVRNGMPGFVAGMTPFGIAGLEPNFADEIGTAHIRYQSNNCN